MKNYKSRIERLKYADSFLSVLDKLPQLEKEPNLQSTNKTTQEGICKALRNLKQMELVGEDPPHYAVFRIQDPQKIEKDLSREGIRLNENESYGWWNGKGTTDIKNYTGIPYVSINILTQTGPAYVDEDVKVLRSFEPKRSALEIFVIQ